MPVSYQFRRGTDIPPWIWLRQFPAGNSNPGTSNTYDGVRYMYWVVQIGTTATSASTTVLYRFDTWTNGWQFLATCTSGNQGMDIEYDQQRNVLYILTGGALTSWQVFNLNTTSVTIISTVCAAWSLTTMTPILTTAANLGSSITQPTWQEVPGAISVTTGVAPFTTAPTPGNLGAGTTIAGGSTTSLLVNVFFTPGMIGLMVKFDAATPTVALQNQTYIISAVPAGGNSATTSAAMAAIPAAGDSFTVILPSDVTSGVNTATTMSDTTAWHPWAVNQYANSDVVITSGLGAGQRRRIASNTATVLTLNAAVAGNANTGVWTTVPDATSVYQIQPSADFLYYFVANSLTTTYKIDLSMTAAVWVALAVTPATLAGGSNTLYPKAAAPFSLFITRGIATSTIYYYSIGLNSFITPVVFAGQETFNTGSGACLLHGKKKLLITKEGSQRNYILDLVTNILEPFPESMYAAPSANDGKRVRYVKTADGVEWVYQMRAGGQELWRIPLEWLG